MSAALAVVVNMDLDATAAPFGNLGIGTAFPTAAIFGYFVYDVGHINVSFLGQMPFLQGQQHPGRESWAGGGGISGGGVEGMEAAGEGTEIGRARLSSARV